MILSDPMLIGVNIRNFRRKKLWSQEKAAEKAGLGFRTYADAERGASGLRLPTFLSICRALSVTPNDILVIPDPTPDVDELTDKLLTLTEAQYALVFRIISDVSELTSAD